jgi:phosphate:Na+ symporter
MNSYIDIWKLLAGLSLFLLGMKLLENALEQLSGRHFQQVLRNSSKSPIRSVFTGMITTTIVQSSSLVSLIVLAFVGIGILPLVNAIGIVIGSNLGTTFTGWIVATIGFKFDLTNLIYPILGISGLCYGILKRKWQAFSLLTFGLALLLMGLDFMKGSTSTITSHIEIELLSGYPLIMYLILGTVLSAIIQSSSAVMMLTLSALFTGIIPLPEAASLVIGADLGTTSTVLLGSIQGSVSKRQLAMAHVLFNVFVDILAFIFIYPLLELIKILGIFDPLYTLVAFHSLFNFFGLIVFLPFIKQYARLLKFWIKKDDQHLSLYINNVAENITDTAIEALSKETHYLLFLVVQLNLRFLQIKADKLTSQNGNLHLPKTLINASNIGFYIAIKKLEGEIIHYAFKIKIDGSGNEKDLQKKDASERINGLMKAIRLGIYSAKALKDIEKNIQSFTTYPNHRLNNFFEQLQKNAVSLYTPIQSIFHHHSRNDILNQDLLPLSEKLHIFHNDFKYKIYSKMNSSRMTTLELSTLLNVNKEMSTSEKALIKAISLHTN